MAGLLGCDGYDIETGKCEWLGCGIRTSRKLVGNVCCWACDLNPVIGGVCDNPCSWQRPKGLVDGISNETLEEQILIYRQGFYTNVELVTRVADIVGVKVKVQMGDSEFFLNEKVFIKHSYCIKSYCGLQGRLVDVYNKDEDEIGVVKLETGKVAEIPTLHLIHYGNVVGGG